MKFLEFLFPAIFFGLFLASCITAGFEKNRSYDSRAITIQTLSLFNQRQQSRLSKSSWKGDWIFRRARLDLIDQGLRNIKPDLLIVQESLSKKESPSESDRNILLAGALTDYDWHLRVVKEYEDTQEVESMAVAAGLPLRIDRARTLSRRELWDIGTNGYITTAAIDMEGQPLTVFNVQMPASETNRDLWYLFIKDRIIEILKEDGTCKKRIIVAGYLPGSEDSVRYREFISALGLKDVSAGFCELASSCYTSTPINQIFMATVGDERPSRTDRILVHKSTIVRSSSTNFTESKQRLRSKKFGISGLWAAQRYGWVTSVNFARCSDSIESKN